MNEPITLTLVENGLIGHVEDWPEPPADRVLVNGPTFRLLCSLVTDTDKADPLLTVFWQKGRETIRVHNYVGLIGLPDGTQIEILPKIRPGDAARSVLLTMLRCLHHSPFRTLTPARTSAVSLPLWEVFVRAFLDEAEPIIRRGIQRTYVTVEQTERFMKGKLQVARHQRENACRADRLAVAYDQISADCPPNRILKTTLLALQHQPLSVVGRQRIRQLLWALDDVSTSDSIPDDLQKARRNSRLFKAYEPALQWAEALLSGRAFGVKSGRQLTISLLFPMQRVYEDYVAYAIRKHWPAGVVTVQESSAHLVEEHVGAPKFKLRPDILIRQDNRTMVLDTKWKEVNGADRRGNYGIEQSDLYQLYAYGKKYAADDLFLIYPANETFREPLDLFGYDPTTRLHVVPFDVTNPPADEVEKLARYALSFQ